MPDVSAISVSNLPPSLPPALSDSSHTSRLGLGHAVFFIAPSLLPSLRPLLIVTHIKFGFETRSLFIARITGVALRPIYCF